MQLIAFGSGLFIIAAALLDWDWFFNHWRAALFVRLFGRNGARIFYVVLGALLLFLGHLLTVFSRLPAAAS